MPYSADQSCCGVRVASAGGSSPTARIAVGVRTVLRASSATMPSEKLSPTTFERDITLLGALVAELPPIAEMLANRLSKAGVQAGNVIVKVKTTSFEMITLRTPLSRPTNDAIILSRVAARIIETKFDPSQGARLLGLPTDQLIPNGTERIYAVPLFADLD